MEPNADPAFSIWNVYPLISVPFGIIVGGTILEAYMVGCLRKTSYKRVTIATVLILFMFYIMLVWNVSKNMGLPAGWDVFFAYLLYVISAQFVIERGKLTKDTYMAWAGWFFLILTVTHFLCVNMWYIDTKFKWLILVLLTGSILLNRTMFPRYKSK